MQQYHQIPLTLTDTVQLDVIGLDEVMFPFLNERAHKIATLALIILSSIILIRDGLRLAIASFFGKLYAFLGTAGNCRRARV